MHSTTHEVNSLRVRERKREKNKDKKVNVEGKKEGERLNM